MCPQLSVKAVPGDHDQANRFLALIDGLVNKRVAIVGDVIADVGCRGCVACWAGITLRNAWSLDCSVASRLRALCAPVVM